MLISDTGRKEYVISVKGLHKYFGNTHVLRGIDFDVHPGELISIIGRSGWKNNFFKMYELS